MGRKSSGDENPFADAGVGFRHTMAPGEVVPASALMTEEKWEARMREDKFHEQASEGHFLTEERDIVCRMPVKRSACTCGWRGEWFRIRSSN